MKNWKIVNSSKNHNSVKIWSIFKNYMRYGKSFSASKNWFKSRICCSLSLKVMKEKPQTHIWWRWVILDLIHVANVSHILTKKNFNKKTTKPLVFFKFFKTWPSGNFWLYSFRGYGLTKATLLVEVVECMEIICFCF